MSRKDNFLDYKVSRKNRDKRDGKRRRKYSFKKSVTLLLMSVISLAAGATVYFLCVGLFNDGEVKSTEKGYVLLTGEDMIIADVPGAYGLSRLLKAPEDIIKAEDQKTWMSDFIDTRSPVIVKGIYVTFEGITKIFDSVMQLIDQTELNTIIIDVKDDEGRLTFFAEGELIDEYGTSRNYISDINGVIKDLKEHNVYVIARIVSFKDVLLGGKRPDLVLHNNDGTIYKDYAGMIWLNPFKQEVLDYLVEIAKNCALAGFDEVNFDYIRFPTDGKISEIDLSEGGGEKTKIDAITEAVKYLCEKIKPIGLYVSADVFGGIITSAPDQRNVGQNYTELSKYLDYICPMIYPSHYANGYYGVDYPDTQPYTIMYRALMDSQKVLSEIDETMDGKAIVRPWLQDFTASYLKHYISYGAKEVRTQIDAVYDAGYTQWFLWNASMKYTKGALMTEDEAEEAYRSRPEPTKVLDQEKSTDNETVKKKDTGQYYDSPWKADETQK